MTLWYHKDHQELTERWNRQKVEAGELRLEDLFKIDEHRAND